MIRYKAIIFTLLIMLYGFMYVATSYEPPCTGDCEIVRDIGIALRENRDYVNYTYRCGTRPASDSLCVFVNPVTNVDWNLFADTVCNIASMKGLQQQKIFIITSGAFPADTVIRRSCP